MLFPSPSSENAARKFTVNFLTSSGRKKDRGSLAISRSGEPGETGPLAALHKNERPAGIHFKGFGDGG